MSEEALQKSLGESNARIEALIEELDALGQQHARQAEECADARALAERLQRDLVHLGRVQSLGEMAGSIAHELKQPLGVILMWAEVAAIRVRKGVKANRDELLAALEDIASEAHRAGQIVGRIRDFIGKQPPHREAVDIEQVVDDVLSLAESDLRHAEVVVNRQFDPSLAPITADKIQLEQVLLNLVRNAIDAMGETPREARELTIKATTAADAVEVSVCDAGDGIPAESLDRLFGSFYTTKTEGMGMGLAICRMIVEAHGGRIRAENNAGRGATFTFSLPIDTEN